MIHKSKFVLFSLVFLFTSFCYAGTNNSHHNSFYAGVIGGYGSTTWHGLVATEKNQNLALMLSTPVDSEEGGPTWGLLAGYEFGPNFAIEVNYMRYADATVYFNEISLFSFTHENLSSFTTRTDSVSLVGKFMLPVYDSGFRVFSSAGAASILRKDMIIEDKRFGPSFGVGANYIFDNHLMAELAANYIAGFGESQLSPVDTYYPFIYSVTARIAYRF